MGGLLYKDFISINGKSVVRVLSVFTVLIIILRLILVFVTPSKDWLVENDKGEVFNFFEALLLIAAQMLAWVLVCYIEMWIPRIIKNDEKGKLHNFLSALPVSKRAYIASKYVFIGICVYASFSLCLVWNVIVSAFLDEGYVLDLIMLCQAFSLPLFCMILFGASVEFPVFAAFGKEKGQMIKTGILESLAMLAVGYLFFGDLNVFEKIDIDRIVAWADTHSFALTLISVISPLIALSLYYISYRISVHIYEGKERDYE